MTAVLRERALPLLVNVRGAPPVAANEWRDVDGRRVVWLGPDECLVFDAVEANYAGAASATDVSANYVCFELAGEGALDVLATGCSLDLERMAPGSSAQTLLARAPAILLREEDCWAVLVRRSYGAYMYAWLEDALTNLPATR